MQGGMRRRVREVEAVAKVILSWAVRDHIARMAGLEMCLRAKRRKESQRAMWVPNCTA